MKGRGTVLRGAMRLTAGMSALLGLSSMQLGAAPDPTVEFLKPLDGETLTDDSAPIEVAFTGSEEQPIVRVEVRVEGAAGPRFSYTPPQPEPVGTCSFSWALAETPNAQYRLTATATDAAGRAASATVTVKVQAAEQRGPRRGLPLQLRPLNPGPLLEILRRRGAEAPPGVPAEPGGTWFPTNPPQRSPGKHVDWGPGGVSQDWYPVLPPRPIGRQPVGGGAIRVGPGGETIIIPRGGELQDMQPRQAPDGTWQYEFRLPGDRGRGTIRIVPPKREEEEKGPEGEPKEKKETE